MSDNIMKWKQRKHKSRTHAQQSKKHRGRSSGVTRNRDKQQKTMDTGFNKLWELLFGKQSNA